MKKLLFTLMFAMSSMGGILPNIGKLFQPLAVRPPFAGEVAGTPKFDPNKCSNFAGKWKGSCEGSTREETLTLSQTGCVVFTVEEFGKLPLMVGADNTFTLALPSYSAESPAMVGSANWSLSWNVDQTALTVEAGYRSNNLATNEAKNSSGTGKAEFKLDGEKMVVITQSSTEAAKSCTFAKQQ